MTCRMALFLPLLFVLLLPFGLLATYLLSDHFEHLNDSCPRVSELSAQQPESSLYGIVLNLSALLFSLIVVLKFAHFNLYNLQYKQHRTVAGLKYGLLVVGLLTSLGFFLAANVESSSSKAAQLAGIWSVFVFGTLYCLGQTMLTFAALPHRPVNKRGLAALRLLLSAALTIVLLCLCATGENALEWTTLVLIALFTATLAAELNMLHLKPLEAVQCITFNEPQRLVAPIARTESESSFEADV